MCREEMLHSENKTQPWEKQIVVKGKGEGLGHWCSSDSILPIIAFVQRVTHSWTGFVKVSGTCNSTIQQSMKSTLHLNRVYQFNYKLKTKTACACHHHHISKNWPAQGKRAPIDDFQWSATTQATQTATNFKNTTSFVEKYSMPLFTSPFVS